MTAEEAIVDVFERRAAAALFVTEVQYGIVPPRDPAEFAAALERLVESWRDRHRQQTRPRRALGRCRSAHRRAGRTRRRNGHRIGVAELARRLPLHAPLLVNGKRLRIGVDIGGTFTDVTVMDPADGSVTFGKALSTPDDLVRGILDAIAVTGRSPRDAEFIIHGSTVAINAILERNGAKTALVTTAGFPRRLRDRPREPARFVQPRLPQARAADPARAAL